MSDEKPAAEEKPKVELKEAPSKEAKETSASAPKEGDVPKETTEIEPVEKPKPKEYTPEEIEAITKRVETPKNQTPDYDPKRILSKEFKGTSSYEVGLATVRKEFQDRLKNIRKSDDPDAIRRAEDDLQKLDHLYQNYHIGMNVFRTAKGGRDKLRV